MEDGEDYQCLGQVEMDFICDVCLVGQFVEGCWYGELVEYVDWFVVGGGNQVVCDDYCQQQFVQCEVVKFVCYLCEWIVVGWCWWWWVDEMLDDLYQQGDGQQDVDVFMQCWCGVVLGVVIVQFVYLQVQVEQVEDYQCVVLVQEQVEYVVMG